jgi:O-antigen/teichoic acid export membrane protein
VKRNFLQIKETLSKVRIFSEGVDFLKVSIGKSLNAGFALFINIIIARELGARDFGIFFFSISVLVVALELCASEGIDVSLVRFGARYQRDHDETSAALLFRVALKIKCLLVCVIGIGGYALAGTIATRFLHKPEAALAIEFGVFGACGASLWRYTLALLQTYRRFNTYALLTIIPNALKVGIILLFSLFNSLALLNVLVINTLAPFLGFLIGIFLTSKYFFGIQSDEAPIRSELFRFSKWVVLSNLSYVLYTRLDIFMLGYYVTDSALGIYAVAANLITGLQLLYASLLTILLPLVSTLKTQSELSAYVRKSVVLSGILAVFILPLVLFAKEIIIVTFSEKFLESVTIFRILSWSFICGLIFDPLALILYLKNKPYLVTFIYLMVLCFMFVTNLFIIPGYGIEGAAFVVLGAKFWGGVLLAGCLYYTVFKPVRIQDFPT